MKKLVIIFLCVVPLMGLGQHSGKLGLEAGYSFLFGSKGFMFNDPPNTPNGRYGLFAGLSFARPLDKVSFLQTGIYYHFQRYQFLYFEGSTTIDGDFRFNYLYIPISYNRQFKIDIEGSTYEPNIIAGIAMYSGNLANPKNEYLVNSTWSYRTNVYSKFIVEPEVFGGIGYLAKGYGIGSLQYKLLFHFDPLKNLLFNARVVDSQENTTYSEVSMRNNRISVSVAWYPHFEANRKGQDKWWVCPTF